MLREDLIDEMRLQMWLEAYGYAWLTGDSSIFVRLFTPDACYCRIPLGYIIAGRDAITAAWQGEALHEADFEVEWLMSTGQAGEGAVFWQRRVLLPARQQVVCRGILLVQLTEQGLCQSLAEMREPATMSTTQGTKR